MAESLRTLDADDDAYKVVQRIVAEVGELTRWKPSRWNGTIQVHNAPGRLDGARRSWRLEPGRWFDGDAAIANRDGSLTIRADSLDWVRKAQAGALKQKHNFKAHQAVVGIVSATVALNRSPEPGPGASHPEDKASAVMTLGLAQDWALQNTSEIIAVTGLNKHVRLLDANPVINAAPHASKAAELFTAGLGSPAQMPVGEIRRQLIGAAPAERWNLIADWLIKAHLNGRDIATDERQELRARLAGLAHDNYAKVAEIPAMIEGMHPEPALRARHRVELALKLGKHYANHALTQLNVENWGAAITLKSEHSATRQVDPGGVTVPGFQQDGAIPPPGTGTGTAGSSNQQELPAGGQGQGQGQGQGHRGRSADAPGRSHLAP